MRRERSRSHRNRVIDACRSGLGDRSDQPPVLWCNEIGPAGSVIGRGEYTVDEIGENGEGTVHQRGFRSRWICMLAKNGTSGWTPILTIEGTSSLTSAARWSSDRLNLAA